MDINQAWETLGSYISSLETIAENLETEEHGEVRLPDSSCMNQLAAVIAEHGEDSLDTAYQIIAEKLFA